MSTDVFTHTLDSGHVLIVSYSATFGEVIIASLLLVLLAVLGLRFILRVTYGHSN
jgi:hypothetical protein